MQTPTPHRPTATLAAARKRQNLTLAWTLVFGVFVLGACCGGVSTALAFILPN